MNKDLAFHCMPRGVLLRGQLAAPNGLKPPYRTVVMLTGDGPKGTRSLSWVNMPPKLHANGIASFLFDFEGLGNSEGERRTLTLTKGIENFRSAMDFLRTHAWVDRDRLGVFASSFGATVLLSAPDLANTFSAIGLKSPAAFLPDAYLAEIGLEFFDRWAADGYLEKNGYTFDVLMDALKYNAYASAREIKSPCLITHGDMDEIVTVTQSKYLAKCLGGTARLEVFEGVGHGYSEGNAWERMAQLFVDWFTKNL